MFCPKCGSEIPEEARVCPYCGAQIRRNDRPEEEIIETETVVVETTQIYRGEPTDGRTVFGSILTLILAAAMSAAAVTYLITLLIFENSIRYPSWFWFSANVLVPFGIYALISIGCWLIWLRGRKGSSSAGGFMLVGAGIIVEIVHWCFVWFMGGAANTMEFINLMSRESISELSAGIMGDMAVYVIIVIIVFGFFAAGALGVQMLISVRRGIHKPARMTGPGESVKWHPSRMSLALPIVMAALTFTAYFYRYDILHEFVEELYLSTLKRVDYWRLPSMIFLIFTIAYIAANIIALVIIIRIRKTDKKGGQENV